MLGEARTGAARCEIRLGSRAASVMLTIPCDTSIVKLFDPLGWDVGPLPEGDGERGEPIVSDIPVWGFDKGLLIIEETGLGELEVFFQFVDLSLVFFMLGPD